MKKVTIVLSMIIVALMINNSSLKAQEKNTGEKYFIGKFNLMVYGLPDGDTKMVLNIAKKEDKLTGTLSAPEQADPPMELSNIAIADSTLNATFYASGMDITLFFKIKDDKNITGNMLNMFDIKGTKEK